MTKVQPISERRAAGSGRGGKPVDATENQAAGGDAQLARSSEAETSSMVAGGNGAAGPALPDAVALRSVAGGSAPDATSNGTAHAVAGGHAASAPGTSPALLAGGDGIGTASAEARFAGGDGAEGNGAAIARSNALSFHVHGPRGHVMTEASIPGIGDVGGSPNYVKRGATTHFVVYYDSALGTVGAVASDAVLAKCESDYNTLRSWFSNATPGSLPFNIYITTDSNGASHASCSSTTLYLGANSASPVNNAFILQLLIAEEDEVFEAAFGHGWNCGASNGEGLSRVLANDLYPGAEPANFVSSHVWLDAPGRPDWINNTESTDRNYVSIGCSVLFLNWMRFQLGYSWTQIIAAGGATLAQTYQNLTGQTDGYALFTALMDRSYPRGTPSGVTTDNPFPLSDLAYSAVFRPSSGAEWVVPGQPWSAMFNTVNTYFRQGLYAEALSITVDDNTVMYSAVFRPGSGSEWVVPAQPWSSMASTINSYFSQGLYMTSLGISASGSEVLYSGVFRPGSGAEWVVSAQPWSQFAGTVNGYFRQGLYVDALASTIVNGEVLYSAVFRPGSGAEWVVSAQPWSSFAPTVDSYFRQGLYARGIAAVETVNGPLYTAVFRPGPGGAEWVWAGLTWKDMAKQIDAYFAQGLYANAISACPLAA